MSNVCDKYILMFRVWWHYQRELSRTDTGPDCSTLADLVLDTVYVYGVDTAPSSVTTTPASSDVRHKYDTDSEVS